MDETIALLGFSALSQATRLDVFRLLVAQEPTGLAAGSIARQLSIPHNTLSTHLGVLSRAGLVTAVRRGRSIVYRARLDGVRMLVGFLLKDCCGGRPEICAPVVAELTPCCGPETCATAVPEISA